jgi:hypothetical protein
MPDPSLLFPELLAETLYAPEYEHLIKRIGEARNRPGTHIVILGEPYAGREYLVKKLARHYQDDAAYISFSSPVGDFSASGIPQATAPILIIEGAQYFFTRTIGGFQQLRAFITFVADTDKTVVSSWNTYAWNYASAVENLDRCCSGTVTVPPLTMERLRDGILASYSGEIRCINDATVKQSVLVSPVTHAIRIPFTSREVNLPGLSIDWNLLFSAMMRRKREESPERIVFSRLEKLSQGNMGIALNLWNESLDYPEIRVSRIHEIPELQDLTLDERFLLVSLLMVESADISAIPRITGEPHSTDWIYLLKAKDIIEEQGRKIRIRPGMLHQTAGHLKAMRMVV